MKSALATLLLLPLTCPALDASAAFDKRNHFHRSRDPGCVDKSGRLERRRHHARRDAARGTQNTPGTLKAAPNRPPVWKSPCFRHPADPGRSHRERRGPLRRSIQGILETSGGRLRRISRPSARIPPHRSGVWSPRWPPTPATSLFTCCAKTAAQRSGPPAGCCAGSGSASKGGGDPVTF